MEAAVVAADAGFDFVDVKACHGYLLHEMLSGVDRPGPYGGGLEGRSRLQRQNAGGHQDTAARRSVSGYA